MTQAMYPPMSFWPPEDQLLHYACAGDEPQSSGEPAAEEARERAGPREEATEPNEAPACKVPSSEVLLVAKVPAPPPPPRPGRLPPPCTPPPPPASPVSHRSLLPSFAAQEGLKGSAAQATVTAADAVLAAVRTPTASLAEASAATVLERRPNEYTIPPPGHRS